MEHWAQNVEKHHSADSSGWVQMELVMTEMQRSLNARCRSFQFQEEVAGGRNDDRNAKVVECAKHCRRFQFQKGVSIRGQATLWFTSGTRLATTPLRAWVRGRRLTTTSWGGWGQSRSRVSGQGGCESQPAARTAGNQKVGIHVVVRHPGHKMCPMDGKTATATTAIRSVDDDEVKGNLRQS